jgi:hypothetical protein
MSFTLYNPEDIVIDSEQVVAPLWSGNANNITSFYTSSVQETGISGLSFLNVYQSPTYASGSEIQFALAYANVSGSGSYPFNSLIPGFTPTRAVYGQYRNLIYGDENSSFTFGNSNFPIGDFFVINIERSRYKEGLRPGSLNLTLNNAGNIIHLTDNSNESTDTNFIGSNEYYSIVSGSNGISYNGSDVQTVSGSYGLFFPNISIILLNARALALPYNQGGIDLTVDQTVSTAYSLGYNKNNSTLFNAISNGTSFGLQSTETISSTYFFTYVKPQDYNYTTNPSIIDNNGNIIFDTLINNPQTFPTTVGLYNNNNELLAVAKLSKPLPKSFVKAMTLRVRLSF